MLHLSAQKKESRVKSLEHAHPYSLTRFIFPAYSAPWFFTLPTTGIASGFFHRRLQSLNWRLSGTSCRHFSHLSHRRAGATLARALSSGFTPCSFTFCAGLVYRVAAGLIFHSAA